MSVVPITTLPTTTNLHCCSLPRIRSISPNSVNLLSKLRRRSLPLTCSLSDGSSSSAAATTTATGVVPDRSLAVKKKATDLMPQLKGTSIFLVGMNNSVKTSLGKLLAETLRYYYFDSDNLVEEAAGGKSGLKEISEEGFRESETEVLKQLSSMGRLVVCAGNGAVQSSTNLGLLRYGLSLWIDVPFSAETELDEELEDLRGGYATADATISLQKVASKLGYDDLTAVTTEDMVMEVLKEIEKLTRVKKMIEAAATPF